LTITVECSGILVIRFISVTVLLHEKFVYLSGLLTGLQKLGNNSSHNLGKRLIWLLKTISKIIYRVTVT